MNACIHVCYRVDTSWFYTTHRHTHIINNTITRLPISLGGDKKSLLGIGTFLVMYSHTTSMLYLSWADIGIIGAPSATVPASILHSDC